MYKSQIFLQYFFYKYNRYLLPLFLQNRISKYITKEQLNSKLCIQFFYLCIISITVNNFNSQSQSVCCQILNKPCIKLSLFVIHTYTEEP